MKTKNTKKTNFQFYQKKKSKEKIYEKSSINLDLKSFHKNCHFKYNSGDFGEISESNIKNKQLSIINHKLKKGINNNKGRDTFTSYKIKSYKNKINSKSKSKSKSKSPNYKTYLTTTNNDTFFSNVSSSIRKPEYDLMEKVFTILGIDSINYVKKMKFNKIDFNDMLLLNKEDLKEMQIPIGPRNRLLCFIENFSGYINQLGIEKIDLDIINNYFQNKNTISRRKYSPLVTSENLFIQHINNSQTINLKSKNNNLSNNNMNNNIMKYNYKNHLKKNSKKKFNINNENNNKIDENNNNVYNNNIYNNNNNNINNNNNHIIKDEIKDYLCSLNISLSSQKSIKSKSKSNSKKKIEKNTKHPINLCIKNLSLDKFLISNRNNNVKSKTSNRERYKRKIGDINNQKNKFKPNSKLNNNNLYFEKNSFIDNDFMNDNIFFNNEINEEINNFKIEQVNDKMSTHKRNFTSNEHQNLLVQLQKEVNNKLNTEIKSTKEKELLIKLLEDTKKLNNYYQNMDKN
jgi:hypothetical protein